MEDEGKATVAGIAPGAAKDYVTVAASRIHELPEPAEARLVWHGPTGELAYTARAGHVDVRTDEGELLGKMFAVSYVADAEGLPAEELDPTAAGRNPRPVTFCYNGGPGSSSMPIHMGGFGPVRVRPDGTEHLSCPPQVEDSPHSLIADSDLVFLDMLGTGWSVLADGVDPKRVMGIAPDAEALVRAIAAWLEEHDRWDSPVYLLGESYGTIRNAVTMRLMGKYGVPLAGVIMLSALFDVVQTLPGEDLYHIGMLPTFAATGQYFGKGGEGVDEDVWFDDAMDFAEGAYAQALLRGDRLPAEELGRVAGRAAELTGTTPAFWLAHNLRPDLDSFRRELLREEGLVIGRLDTRFTTAAPSPLHGSSGFFAGEDAADDAVESAYVAGFRTFMRRTLGYRANTRYLPNNFAKVGGTWDWSHVQPGLDYDTGTPNVAHDIAIALRHDPHLRVAILGGRYDAATTWWNVEHDIACQFMAPHLRANVEFYRYGCGHMAYTDEATAEAMASDLHEFYSNR